MQELQIDIARITIILEEFTKKRRDAPAKGIIINFDSMF
jgi:hypothetical protein